MPFDDTLLDDPVRLAEADTGGLLRATAMAGAQVRAGAESATELELTERLDVGRPRSLVLVGRSGVGRPVAKLIKALLMPDCPVPVVVSDVVPPWIGALDVVYAHTDDPGDRELAVTLERASRYGASVVLSAPADGPVAAAVAGKAAVLTPRIDVGDGQVFARAFVAGLLTADALNLVDVDFEVLADALDAEADRDQLGHESFVNPAKSLALRLAERTPLLWGLDPVATAVAKHAAHALAAEAGVACDVSEYRQAVTRGGLYRAAVSATAKRDIFADTDDAVQPLRLLLLAVRSGASEHPAAEVFGAASVLDIADELQESEPVLAGILALRFELAAVYLGLATGSVGGASRYAPAV